MADAALAITASTISLAGVLVSMIRKILVAAKKVRHAAQKELESLQREVQEVKVKLVWLQREGGRMSNDAETKLLACLNKIREQLPKYEVGRGYKWLSGWVKSVFDHEQAKQQVKEIAGLRNELKCCVNLLVLQAHDLKRPKRLHTRLKKLICKLYMPCGGGGRGRGRGQGRGRGGHK